MRYSGSSDVDALLQLVNGKGSLMAGAFVKCDLGSACSEQDFENFISGRVALLDYSNADCSLYDKVIIY